MSTLVEEISRCPVCQDVRADTINYDLLSYGLTLIPTILKRYPQFSGAQLTKHYGHLGQTKAKEIYERQLQLVGDPHHANEIVRHDLEIMKPDTTGNAIVDDVLVLDKIIGQIDRPEVLQKISIKDILEAIRLKALLLGEIRGDQKGGAENMGVAAVLKIINEVEKNGKSVTVTEGVILK